jgi:hypothetical protein
MKRKTVVIDAVELAALRVSAKALSDVRDLLKPSAKPSPPPMRVDESRLQLVLANAAPPQGQYALVIGHSGQCRLVGPDGAVVPGQASSITYVGSHDGRPYRDVSISFRVAAAPAAGPAVGPGAEGAGGGAHVGEATPAGAA